ncbi:hypothetical protein RJ640_026971 [Escallonia rubra]|uniref:Pentatricopeptide repeat-containing protein n=1 Tax=Escallonia rubra TaxID=112253 RepID=A0AA88UQV2_9ASTE|nr:hypothetical protein RJ640_026971 [Escallonia rubra]
MLRQRDPSQRPNQFVFATVARAIASSPGHIHLGHTIHAHVIKSGYIPGNIVLETAFADMYAKCRFIDFARKVFDEMPERNLVTWNAVIAGYVHNGMEVRGFELFYWMKCRELYLPDEFSVATVLSGCAWTQNLCVGTQVHGYILVSGLESDCVNPIANMYFHCGDMPCAERVLNGIQRDVALELIKIRGYIFNQRYNDTLRYIVSEGNAFEILDSDYTIAVPLLSACAKFSFVKVGKQVHSLLITLVNLNRDFHLLEEDGKIIGSALIDMYSKCGSVSEARKVFDHWVSAPQISHWNAMISGYILNSLVEDARTLFEEMPEKNVVSWTTMISGYLQTGIPQESLNLLTRMYSEEEGVRVDGNCLTYVVGLEACSSLTDLRSGMQIHAKLIRTFTNALASNVVVGTALVDMYAKVGCLCYSQTVFGLMLEKNVIAWTSIITGYAVHGFGLWALDTFRQMIEMGVKPNEVTFISVLTACSHCGLVDEGVQYFKLLTEKYKLVPREDHYTCLINMLGRGGRLEEAYNLLEVTEDRDTNGCSGTIWAAMLGACQLHGNVEIGKRVAKRMLENKNQVSTTSITLSNVYAAAGMWDEAYRVRETWRKEGKIDGEPGLSRVCTHLGVS